MESGEILRFLLWFYEETAFQFEPLCPRVLRSRDACPSAERVPNSRCTCDSGVTICQHQKWPLSMGIFSCSSFISNIFSEPVKDKKGKVQSTNCSGLEHSDEWQGRRIVTATTSTDTCKYFFRNKDFQYLPVTQWSRQLVIAYCDCLWRSAIPWEPGHWYSPYFHHWRCDPPPQVSYGCYDVTVVLVMTLTRYAGSSETRLS